MNAAQVEDVILSFLVGLMLLVAVGISIVGLSDLAIYLFPIVRATPAWLTLGIIVAGCVCIYGIYRLGDFLLNIGTRIR